jgi:hypothetical protein
MNGTSAGCDVGTARLLSLVDNGDDEHATFAHMVDDAPGVSGDLAHFGIVELGHDAADVRRLGEHVGLATHLADDALGVLRRVFGDAVVDGFKVRSSAGGPVRNSVCEAGFTFVNS